MTYRKNADGKTYLLGAIPIHDLTKGAILIDRTGQTYTFLAYDGRLRWDQTLVVMNDRTGLVETRNTIGMVSSHDDAGMPASNRSEWGENWLKDLGVPIRAPEEKTLWLNLYKDQHGNYEVGGVYPTSQTADRAMIFGGMPRVGNVAQPIKVVE